VVVTNVAGATNAAATLTVTEPVPARFLSIEVLPDRRVKLVVTGESGVSYVLQGSGNFLDWAALGTNLNVNGVFEFVDPETNLPARFYRTRE
jgi:hypothetical protein